jgi:hypothetical protein
MEAVVEWRGSLVAVGAWMALVAVGLALVVAGVRLWVLAGRETRDPPRALLIARGFRRAIVGLCAVAFAVGWWTGTGWVMGLAAIIAGEETLESTVAVAVLRDGLARSTARAPAYPAEPRQAPRALAVRATRPLGAKAAS